MTYPLAIGATLEEKRCSPEAVLDHIGEGVDLIVGMGNGEPVTILDAIEAHAEDLSGVRIHQMFPFRERRYMHGDFAGLRHVSWFLSPANREAFRKGSCDLVPNNFGEVPSLMRRWTRCSLVLAVASPSDRHGYFTLGTHADYVAALIGEVPFFVEVDTPHRCDPGWSYVASLACLPGGTTRTLRPSRSVEVFGMVLHSSQLVARASESAKTTRPALRLLSVLEIGLFYGNDRERKWRVFGWHTELPEVQPDRGEAA